MFKRKKEEELKLQNLYEIQFKTTDKTGIYSIKMLEINHAKAQRKAKRMLKIKRDNVGYCVYWREIAKDIYA